MKHISLKSDLANQLMPKIECGLTEGLYQLYSAVNEGKKTLSHRPINQYLTIGLVFDDDKKFVRVSNTDLDGLGISFDEAYDIAIQNLSKRTPQEFLKTITIDEKNIGELSGIYGVDASPVAYNATRMLLIDRIIKQTNIAQPVAFVPNSERLVIASETHGLRSTVFSASLHAAKRANILMCPIPMKYSDSGWEILKETDEQIKYTIYEYLTSKYNVQTDLLSQINQMNGIEINLAKFLVHKHSSTNKLASFCVWREGIESLLPLTDDIVFQRRVSTGKYETVARIAWEKVYNMFKDIMIQKSICPPRYYVGNFPAEHEIKRIL